LTSAVSTSFDSFKCRRTLKVGKREYDYFDLKKAEAAGLDGIGRLPFSLKVLLENLLRHEDGRSVTDDDIRAVADWLKDKRSDREIAFRPARVLMQGSAQDQSAGAGRSRYRPLGDGGCVRHGRGVPVQRRQGIFAQ
jgi:hypothetical protein